MHEELKIEEVTPMSKVEECIFKLNKDMEAIIVKQKEENLKIMIVNDYVSTDIGAQLLVIRNG